MPDGVQPPEPTAAVSRPGKNSGGKCRRESTRSNAFTSTSLDGASECTHRSQIEAHHTCAMSQRPNDDRIARRGVRKSSRESVMLPGQIQSTVRGQRYG